ncbi:MAG: hypothetical protein IJ466_01435 [Clostridia bacterium]|nr:hypothetical protein [Clostridia bacterium]
MPRKPVVTIPTDFFETGNIRALCMKKGGEEALIIYLRLLCMAVKQDRESKLMLYRFLQNRSEKQSLLSAYRIVPIQ